MDYTVQYLTRVADDIAAIDQPARARIKTAIENRLTTQPALFGKPLRGSLAGFRVLRAGDYRIVYHIQKKTVIVVFIGDRKHIYRELKRLL